MIILQVLYPVFRMGDSDYRPRLFIGGLKGPVDKEELTQAFTEFGNIVDVWVAYDPPGFAFVEYDNMDSAKAAKEQMHLADLFDTQIRYVLKLISGEKSWFGTV